MSTPSLDPPSYKNTSGEIHTLPAFVTRAWPDTVFLDTQFTDFIQPELLSLGLVAQDGREFYVELDLMTEEGASRRKSASNLVLSGVLDMWGLVPGAAATELEMGRRTGEWVLALSTETRASIRVAFDYSTDYELMENAIRDAGLWDRVREVVVPVDVSALTRTTAGELAAEECFAELRTRGLRRHHALADAHALAAAYKKAAANEAAQPLENKSI